MKLGATTAMRYFLFNVMMLLMGTAMKTMKDFGQALSMDSFFGDGGLGGDDVNLQVIESSLMSMVREGTSPSLKPGIWAIYNLTTEMQAAVENKSNHEQNNLTLAWWAWTNCTPGEGQRQLFNNSMGAMQEACSVEVTSGLADWNGNPYHGTVFEWASEYCKENCSMNCSNDLPLCPSTPFACEKDWEPHEDNTDVKKHMYYLQQVFAEGSNTEGNCRSNNDNCTEQCEMHCPPGWNNTFPNCSDQICHFEKEACDLFHDSCLEYHTCYFQEGREYNETQMFVEREEQANKQEWRAILRIQCLLNAFLASIDLNESLGEGITTCINTTYNTSNITYYGPVTMHYYNKSTNPLRKCPSNEDWPNFDPPFNEPPGGEAWRARYYAPLGATDNPEYVLPTCSNQHAACENLNMTANTTQ